MKEYDRFEDDEDEFIPKFDECHICKNKFNLRTCDECDVGENFEEEDPEDLQDMMRNLDGY